MIERAVALANEVRKAILAATAVATTIAATEGIPTDVRSGATAFVAVVGVFGIVYGVKNISR